MANNTYSNLIIEKDIKLEETLEHLEAIQKSQKFIETTEFLQSVVQDVFELKNQLTEEFSEIKHVLGDMNDLTASSIRRAYTRSIDGLNQIILNRGLIEEASCTVCNSLRVERLSEIVNNLMPTEDATDTSESNNESLFDIDDIDSFFDKEELKIIDEITEGDLDLYDEIDDIEESFDPVYTISARKNSFRGFDED